MKGRTVTNRVSMISIIMPAFNVESYVSRAIHSMLHQTYPNFELIIADDLSVDGTRTILEQFDDPRIKCYHNTEKLGYTKTCNRLFPLCIGDFITFQDADDFSTPDRLEKQLNYLQCHPEVYMCGTGAFIITAKGKVLDVIYRPENYETILEGLPAHNQFIGSTIMCKREVYDKMGGYRAEFSRWGNQDYDWSYRICELFNATNLQEPLYYYRQHISSNSKRVSKLRAIGPKVVQTMGEMRKTTGSDSLMDNDKSSIDNLEQELLRPFEEDAALIYYFHAKNRIYIHQYQQGMQLIMKSIRFHPFRLKYYVFIINLLFRMTYRRIKNQFNEK